MTDLPKDAGIAQQSPAMLSVPEYHFREPICAA
jgi:hypothetical protein